MITLCSSRDDLLSLGTLFLALLGIFLSDFTSGFSATSLATTSSAGTSSAGVSGPQRNVSVGNDSESGSVGVAAPGAATVVSPPT